MGILAFVWPSGGGHLMFVPMHAIDVLGAVGMGMGVLNP